LYRGKQQEPSNFKLMPSFYDLSKSKRSALVSKIQTDILTELQTAKSKKIVSYFSDDDTYIRKSAYLAVGRIYITNAALQSQIIKTLEALLQNEDFKTRQTVINAAGEIGKTDFKPVQHFFDTGLFDKHHSPRNAVIGSIKKMGEVNPKPVLSWAKKYLQHEDKEIRREICHGIELRGRKFPQDILPLLQELQNDNTARVRNTLIHVIGQIAYKKGCLQTVVDHLQSWSNKALVEEALEEIIDVHHRYRNFSALTQEQARQYIFNNYRRANFKTK
jgi:HEAT repeat protein